MTRARDDFEEWREGTLSGLKLQREPLAARLQDVESRPPVPRSAGAVPEELARDLEAYCQRRGFVEATLEMVRRSTPGSPTVYDQVLRAKRADSPPETYTYLIQPFWRLAREYLEKQPGDCELFARLDGATRRVEVTAMDGSTHQQKEQKELKDALAQLDAETARIKAMKLDFEPFGPELARRVVRMLNTTGSLHDEHRDYCGMGLFVVGNGAWVYTSVWDGYFSEQNVVRRFKDSEELERWLARQSEASLSNYAMDAFYFRNQTLTRERLEEFAESSPMTSVRDEFEKWLQGELSTLKRQRETLAARLQELEAQRPASRSAGAVAEEQLKELKKDLFWQGAREEQLNELARTMRSLSTKPFGPDLAWRVVRKLGKSPLHYEHRDYCGMALFSVGNGAYVYTSVEEGYFIDGMVVRRFKDQEEVVRWLAEQSDASLSNYAMGAGYFRNQTLTRERLEAFAGS